MATSTTPTVTILFDNGHEEFIEDVTTGLSGSFVVLFNSLDQPIRFINKELVDTIYCEYPDDEGIQVSFEPDVGRTLN